MVAAAAAAVAEAKEEAKKEEEEEEDVRPLQPLRLIVHPYVDNRSMP